MEYIIPKKNIIGITKEIPYKIDEIPIYNAVIAFYGIQKENTLLFPEIGKFKVLEEAPCFTGTYIKVRLTLLSSCVDCVNCKHNLKCIKGGL